MPSSEIVSDTGPLISLEKLPQGFSLLRQLFTKIYLPPEVLDELQSGHSGGDYLRDYGLEDRVEVVSSPLLEMPEADRLDPGERSAIALAISKGCSLLIEERLGRKLAEEAGVNIIGAVGLLKLAYQRGVLSQSDAIEMLLQLYEARRIGKPLYEAMWKDLATG